MNPYVSSNHIRKEGGCGGFGESNYLLRMWLEPQVKVQDVTRLGIIESGVVVVYLMYPDSQWVGSG